MATFHNADYEDLSAKDIRRMEQECALRGRQRNAAMKKVKLLMAQRDALLAAAHDVLADEPDGLRELAAIVAETETQVRSCGR
jgi:hypothetical protein